MKILVIEDEMSLLDAIKIRLIKEKYDVDTCIDEKEKLEQLVKDIMENCLDWFDFLHVKEKDNILNPIFCGNHSFLTIMEKINDFLR